MGTRQCFGFINLRRTVGRPAAAGQARRKGRSSRQPVLIMRKHAYTSVLRLAVSEKSSHGVSRNRSKIRAELEVDEK